MKLNKDDLFCSLSLMQVIIEHGINFITVAIAENVPFTYVVSGRIPVSTTLVATKWLFTFL